jgi:hypothetical protein
VAAKKYAPRPGELRFDMFEAEFTHAGDRCSFEVMIERLGLMERVPAPLAEIVHDIDLKDGKFGRLEAAGVKVLMEGLAAAHPADLDRIERGSKILDDLLEYFRRQVKT